MKLYIYDLFLKINIKASMDFTETRQGKQKVLTGRQMHSNFSVFMGNRKFFRSSQVRDSYLTKVSEEQQNFIQMCVVVFFLNNCGLLLSQALQYGSEDNSTIIVVPFGAWGKHKSSDSSFSFSRSFVSSGRWAQSAGRRMKRCGLWT